MDRALGEARGWTTILATINTNLSANQLSRNASDQAGRRHDTLNSNWLCVCPANHSHTPRVLWNNFSYLIEFEDWGKVSTQEEEKHIYL